MEVHDLGKHLASWRTDGGSRARDYAPLQGPVGVSAPLGPDPAQSSMPAEMSFFSRGKS